MGVRSIGGGVKKRGCWGLVLASLDWLGVRGLIVPASKPRCFVLLLWGTRGPASFTRLFFYAAVEGVSLMC